MTIPAPAPVAIPGSTIWDPIGAAARADKKARKVVDTEPFRTTVMETVTKAERAEVYFSREKVWLAKKM